MSMVAGLERRLEERPTSTLVPSCRYVSGAGWVGPPLEVVRGCGFFRPILAENRPGPLSGLRGGVSPPLTLSAVPGKRIGSPFFFFFTGNFSAVFLCCAESLSLSHFGRLAFCICYVFFIFFFRSWCRGAVPCGVVAGGGERDRRAAATAASQRCTFLGRPEGEISFGPPSLPPLPATIYRPVDRST